MLVISDTTLGLSLGRHAHCAKWPLGYALKQALYSTLEFVEQEQSAAAHLKLIQDVLQRLAVNSAEPKQRPWLSAPYQIICQWMQTLTSAICHADQIYPEQ